MIEPGKTYVCGVTSMIVLVLRAARAFNVSQWEVAVLAPPVYVDVETDEPFDVATFPSKMFLSNKWLYNQFTEI